uniref:Putative two-component response regulator-like APRR1 n=1 Tax=Davidia involucrata TaxID=16924 RepID=A0A5B7AUY0_DAVIN
MERNEVVSSKAGDGAAVGGGNNSKSGDPFIDRSKVRILLWDNDAKSSEEVFTLLCECSYQVTSVRSARQVIDALNAEGPDIDIILSEVDLPMAKGLKMLKYIMRDKELRRIPVIMMSAQDEVSVVVKCLRLGAADYLVKPLRTNELLNLWTHMWRRRRMLGLAEKNILNYDFDLVASDPSDANTNSTTLFSDDTDDKSWKSANTEMCVSTHQEDESNAAIAAAAPVAAIAAAAPVEPPLTDSFECRPDVPGISDRRTGQFSSCPKKSELKIGESSAFFTYVKSSVLRSNAQGVAPVYKNAPQHSRVEKELTTWDRQVGNDTQEHENREACENLSQGDDFPSSNSIPSSLSGERSLTPPVQLEFPQQMNSKTEEFSQVHLHPRNDSHHDVSGFHAQYPYYISGVMNQVVMSSSAQMYQKNLQDMQNHATSAMLPQYNHIPLCPPHVPAMASYPYYPVSMCLQPGQMAATHPWPSYGSSSSTERKLGKVDRREAALIKFRQKRKERCFDKKIRYVNRKQLAERRPRVRGQFVRKMNGVNVDLNGQPASIFDEDEEDPAAQDSSPEDDASVC